MLLVIVTTVSTRRIRYWNYESYALTATERTFEIGIMKAVEASEPLRYVVISTCESLILATIGGITGIIIGRLLRLSSHI